MPSTPARPPYVMTRLDQLGPGPIGVRHPHVPDDAPTSGFNFRLPVPAGELFYLPGTSKKAGRATADMIACYAFDRASGWTLTKAENDTSGVIARAESTRAIADLDRVIGDLRRATERIADLLAKVNAR